jgi:thermopsin
LGRVFRGLAAVALICLLALPMAAMVYAPQQVRGQTQGVTEQQFQQYLFADHYNYTAITVQNPAIIGYATKSNVSVYTAFMTADQLAALSRPDPSITNAVFLQEGQENYNALLEVPGTYYIVVYSPSAPANATGTYIVNDDIDLRNSSTSVALTITLQPGEMFSIPLHLETLGSTSKVDILGASDQVVQYALENKTAQQLVFRSRDVTITNFTVIPTISLGYNLTLSPGAYVMGIQNESPDSAVVYFQYNIIPAYVNPYVLHFGTPSPTGIAAYGISNASGDITAYKVATSSIVGFAEVSELTAVDNGTNAPLASLQQNTILQVNNTDGASFTYWPQNVLAFDTSIPTVTYRDNVLNTTGDDAQLTNQSIVGTGTTSSIVNDGISQTYYGNYNSNYTYSYKLPQAWVLYTNETVERGTGVLIQMGVRALYGPDPDMLTWFDRITIEDSNVSSADFIVNGRAYTPAGADLPIGSYYDAELVFGGGAGGMAAHFQVSAELALFYLDQTLKPFPSLYTFGDDTAEAAYNIQVVNGNGAAVATTGTPYFGVLTNDFNASLTSLVAQAPKPAAASSSTGYIIAAAAIAVIVIFALAIALRRRATAATQFQTSPVGPPITAFCGTCGSAIDPSARYCPSCGAPQANPGAGTADGQAEF